MKNKNLIYHLIQICSLEESKDTEDRHPEIPNISLELLLVGFVQVLGHDKFITLLSEYEDDIESRQLLEWYGNYLTRKPDEYGQYKPDSYTIEDYFSDYDHYSINAQHN